MRMNNVEIEMPYRAKAIVVVEHDILQMEGISHQLLRSLSGSKAHEVVFVVGKVIGREKSAEGRVA